MSRVRRALLRRVDHVWDKGWLNLVGLALVGFFLFLTWTPLTSGIDNLRAERQGVGGTLTITRCAMDEWGKGDPWWCHGTFVSDDGTLRISDVKYGFYSPEDPRTPGERLDVDVLVAGPGSSTAWPPGKEWQPSLIVGVLGLILTGMVFLWWVSPGRAVAPTPPPPPPAGGPRGRVKGRRSRNARRRR
ncbi:hypothetical protein V6V47_02955 [Micromonospora sp. CPCC 205539]|uniref:hypothetical protein n=1 Tax=Micromonospora sp. CPCC 205539 TaxID=3122408 RepID=UPI002FF03EC2